MGEISRYATIRRRTGNPRVARPKKRTWTRRTMIVLLECLFTEWARRAMACVVLYLFCRSLCVCTPLITSDDRWVPVWILDCSQKGSQAAGEQEGEL